MRLEPEGRLELTWSNKTLRLLSHGEDTYEWCDPTDFRVSEVRLLEEVMTVGDPGDNLVIQGDAMHALESLIRLPEFAGRYLGKVKCCYIDPPFRTGQTFKDYDDALEHSVWLTLLRDRLTQIHKLLSNDGSVWVHLDDGESHRARGARRGVRVGELHRHLYLGEAVRGSRTPRSLPTTTSSMPTASRRRSR